ncbi:MAG: hypothetical protein AAF961_01375 [Planctomycetota bacterium]
MKFHLTCLFFLTAVAATAVGQRVTFPQATSDSTDVAVDYETDVVAQPARPEPRGRSTSQRNSRESRPVSRFGQPDVMGSAHSLVKETSEIRELEKQLKAATAGLSRLRTAAEGRSDAEIDQDLSAAREEIRTTLDRIYTARLDAYDDHIEALQKRLRKMKQHVDKRRDAKEEMVSLRMKMIEANANGLGWPDGRMPQDFASPSQMVLFPGLNEGDVLLAVPPPASTQLAAPDEPQSSPVPPKPPAPPVRVR